MLHPDLPLSLLVLLGALPQRKTSKQTISYVCLKNERTTLCALGYQWGCLSLVWKGNSLESITPAEHTIASSYSSPTTGRHVPQKKAKILKLENKHGSINSHLLVRQRISTSTSGLVRRHVDERRAGTSKWATHHILRCQDECIGLYAGHPRVQKYTKENQEQLAVQSTTLAAFLHRSFAKHDNHLA